MLRTIVAAMAIFYTGACGGDSQATPDAAGVDASPNTDATVEIPTVDFSIEPFLNWAWANGDIGEDVIVDVVVDSQGNSYFVGRFQISVTIGDETASIPNDGIHPFLASVDAEGNVRWLKTFGALSYSIFNELALSSDGDLYWTASFGGLMNFGDGRSLSAPEPDLFVARFDPDGAVQWAVAMGVDGEFLGPSVAVSDTNRVYFASAFRGPADFGDGEVTTMGSDLVVMEVDPESGSPFWAHTFGGDANELSSDLTARGNSVVLVGSSFSSSVNFAGSTADTFGSNDLILAKYDADGNPQWLKRHGSGQDDSADSVAIDSEGNVHACGTFEDTINVGGDTFSAVPMGTFDQVLFSLTAEGAHRWSRMIGGNGRESHRKVAVDRFDQVYFTGGMTAADPPDSAFPAIVGQSDSFVQRVDPNDGAAQQTWTASGVGTDSFTGLAFDGKGQLHLSGIFHGGDLTVGAEVFENSGSFDFYFARFDYPPLQE